MVDFINTEAYFSPLEKRKSGRIGATAKPAEARNMRICHLRFVIYHWPFDDLKVAGLNDKLQITNKK